jgi:hypothetical protein
LHLNFLDAIPLLRAVPAFTMDYSKYFSGTPEQKLGQLAWFAETCARMTEKLSCILLGEKVPFKVVNLETGEDIIPANRKLTRTILRDLAQRYGDHLLEYSALLPIYAQFRTEEGHRKHLTPWKFEGEDDCFINRKVFSMLYAEMMTYAEKTKK